MVKDREEKGKGKETLQILALPFFFCLFRYTPGAYGSSQTRGQIGATAGGLHHSHSNVGSKLHLHPMPQLTAALDPYSPTGIRIKPAPSWILAGFVTVETQGELLSLPFRME